MNFVDLGLSVLWAETNLGANEDYQIGNRFAWAETSPQSLFAQCFSWFTYKYGRHKGGNPESVIQISKYSRKDGIENILPEDDAATEILGNGCRIPTPEEFEELLTVSHAFVTDYKSSGNNGILFTASNGNTLFIPANGSVYEGLEKGVNTFGTLWTSERDSKIHTFAKYFYFCKDTNFVFQYFRSIGRCIRPVKEK